MISICFYLHAHQPHRLKNYSVFEIGSHAQYFDYERNKEYLARIIRKSYLPTNRVLLDLIKATDGRFKVSFSITGSLLEQLNDFPEVIESFQKLVDTGCVELLSETYYHSLAYLFSQTEFKEQVSLHRRLIKKLFHCEPKVFRNTELMFNNDLAKTVQDMGYKGILAEGADYVLGWRSPNFLYRVKSADKIKILLRNYRLSDDLAFRFSSHEWPEWPLTADKYAHWINQTHGSGEVVNLFMDYETFGEHQWAETGIFDFLKCFPFEVLKHKDTVFHTPSEIVQQKQPVAELDFPHITSWADTERDLSAWLGNSMQKSALAKLYSLENTIKEAKNCSLLDDWRKLQTADHFYYMCTKWFSDGDVHKYFNPYESPYEAFITFMNIFNDLKLRVGSRD